MSFEKITYGDVMRFAWHICRPRRRTIPFLLIGMGFAAFIDTLFPVVVGRLIGLIVGETVDPATLLSYFAIFIGLEFLYHTVRNTTIFAWNKWTSQNLQAVTAEAFAKVQKFSSNWHSNNFAGGTVRKITRGMWSYDVFADNIFLFLYPTLIVMISTVILLSLRWPVMGLITAILSCVYIGFSVWAVLKINAPYSRAAAQADTDVGSTIADAITSNSAVKSFGRELDEEKRLDHVLIRWRHIALKSWNIYVTNDLIRRYISVVMMGSMVGMAIWLWRQGEATPGDVVYVFTAFLVLSAYLRNIGEQISNSQKAISEMEDVVWFWKTDISVKDIPFAPDFVPQSGEIIFQDVTFQYAGQSKALYDHFSLRINPGEKIALVGPSGSGKSTFVKLLQRLYDLQGGHIIIDGQNIAQVTQASLRQNISLVPQDPALFHRSLAENIAYGKPGADMTQIIDAAKKAYAHDFIMSMPQGYNTLVGERGVKLSGGERQRIAIARALLTDSRILILDEATSALDSISEHEIQQALKTLMHGRTTVTVAHRLATIKSVDRILVFDQGRIVEQGTHTSLIAKDASHYQRLYRMQALDLVGEDYE